MPDNESPVKDVNAHEAIESIKAMRSADKLQSIIDLDTRTTVKEAAANRLAEVTGADESEEVVGKGRVWQVEIPGSLIGQQFVLAETEQEAADKYVNSCGMHKHVEPLKVAVTDLDPKKLPEGVTLFG